MDFHQNSLFYHPNSSMLKMVPPGLTRVTCSRAKDNSISSFNCLSPLMGSTKDSLNSMESLNSFQDSPLLEDASGSVLEQQIHELNIKTLDEFKTVLCAIKFKHNQKQCPFFHNNKDHKRSGNFYCMEICPSIQNGEQCRMGEFCNFSHNRVEQLYRDENYKMKFCSLYPGNLDKCEYGRFCSFAHEEDEIRIQLIHRLPRDDNFFMMVYKTVMCPYNTTHHDRSKCVYAHNWQDFRRKPDVFGYSPVECKKWSKNLFIVKYEQGCSKAMQCEACHGWKELEYHPFLYKTRPCEHQNNCNRKAFCTGYHDESERRHIGEIIDSIKNRKTKEKNHGYQNLDPRAVVNHERLAVFNTILKDLNEDSRNNHFKKPVIPRDNYTEKSDEKKRLDVFLTITRNEIK